MSRMNGTETPGLPPRRRPTRQVVTIVAVVSILVATATFATHPWQTGPVVLPSGSGVAEASPTTTSSPGDPADTDWGAIQPTDLLPVATLEPDHRDAAGIQPTAGFALASLTSEPAAALADRLEVSPTVEFDVASATDARHVRLMPARPLEAGTVYRFVLRAPDGSTAASWAYRVRTPIHVLTTIPGNETDAVPVATGIEVTFDQDGVADMADHFSISPTVTGRFERHGRTQVFVPDSLVPSTLYTVTVRAGLTRDGTDLTLGDDVVVHFETDGPVSPDARIQFGREVVETGPTEAPALGVRIVVQDGSDEESGSTSGVQPDDIKTADVRVYRLPGVAAAARVLEDFLTAPRWTAHTDPRMPTEGLSVGAAFTAPLERLADPNSAVIRFPEGLATGFYIVEIAGARPVQAFLQVTPVSAWVSVLTDRTVVWVNDVTTGKPITAASVTVTGGASIGTTDTKGLMVGATPIALVPKAEAGGRQLPPGPPMMTITAPGGALVLVAFGLGSSGEIYRGEWWEKTTSADATYWALLQSDRTAYRSTDTVDVWGYLRGRDDGAVPRGVQLRVVSSDSTGLTDPPAVTEASVKPGTAGAFKASMPLTRAPLGNYVIQAVVSGRVVASRWISVDVIRKPAYQLALVPNHTAVIGGTRVTWSATATFFDGSAVPSLPVRFGEDDRAKTDASGTATLTQVAPVPDPDAGEGVQSWSTSVAPTGPEETEISASADVLVFPATVHLAASGVVTGDQLRLTGSLHTVDLAKVEAKLAAGTYNDDPDGAPVSGAKVKVTVTELVPIRTQVGTDYDFIDKVVHPRYEYTTVRRVVRTVTTTTGARGAIKAKLAVPNGGHQYEVVLSTTDGKGRLERLTIYAGTPAPDVIDAGAHFETSTGPAGDHPYGIGDQVVWRMKRQGAKLPSGGGARYLYIVAQRGLRGVAVTDSPTYRHTYGASDAPGIFIIGVQFTGSTYAPKAAAWADYDAAERRISVTISADKARYRPGDDATLTVRTRDTAGRPVAATAIVGVIDQKLYAIGAAEVPRPLESLYQRVDSGIVRLTATHQVPSNAGSEGEGGDTTGGGGEQGRIDFRDRLAFEMLTTGADGRATMRVHLSDDLTSWHVTASAVTAGLRAGVGEMLIPVGLPLFVEATIADEYLSSDHPIIRVRAFGAALRVGDPVEFTVSSTSLGLPATHVVGKAFKDVSIALPTLTMGTHALDIGVVSPNRKNASGPLADRLIRTFKVVASRLTTVQGAYSTAEAQLPVVGGSDAALYTFTDAGRGRFLPTLVKLADATGGRSDQGLAQAIAHDLLVDAFGRDPATLEPVSFDPTRYEISTDLPEPDPEAPAAQTATSPTAVGMPLLPYSSADAWLTVRVALIAPDRVNGTALRGALETTRNLEGSTRELHVAALAGLAALDVDVSADVTELAAATDLEPIERLYLALAFEAMGDDASARAIERALLREDGRQLGPWIRLDVGADETDRLEATALFMLLAAGLGDPLASNAADYIVAHPSEETTHVLDLAGYVQRALDRTPSAAAGFAYTVAGKRTVVALGVGESATLSLTADQRAGLRIEPVTGRVGVAVSWRDVVDPSTIKTDPDLGLTRTPPENPVSSDRLVTVNLSVTFSPTALTNGCYEVVEVVPSGLAPIWGAEPDAPLGTIWPSEVVGQRVTFCVGYDPKDPAAPALRYRARVVNEGSFAWEPAIMQLDGVPTAIAVTDATTVKIGGS